MKNQTQKECVMFKSRRIIAGVAVSLFVVLVAGFWFLGSNQSSGSWIPFLVSLILALPGIIPPILAIVALFVFRRPIIAILRAMGRSDGISIRVPDIPRRFRARSKKSSGSGSTGNTKRFSGGGGGFGGGGTSGDW